MIVFDLAWLALKQLWRHPVRSGLTVLGVATGMFLFTAVETVQDATRAATERQAGEDRLVVYRANRFCPSTSRLPQHYQSRIERVPGVAAAVPVQVVVNNCGTSLDVVTFRGVPPADLDQVSGSLETVAGDPGAWRNRSDAALVGEVLARRRGLKPGDRFDAAGVTVSVAAIVASRRAMDRDVAWVHLDFLQQASRSGLGLVTQFAVTVEDPADLDRVAAAIDAEFASDSDPTHTRPETAFVAQTARDLLTLVGFTRWVGLGAVVAVLALVANTTLLAVRARVQEHAVLRTIGFGDAALGWLVVVEGMALALAGGAVGALSAVFALGASGLSLASEGLSIVFTPSTEVIVISLLIALALGLIAGLVPAWRAVHRPITASLRMA